MTAAPLLLGIDGGGTKTAAWLARAEAGGPRLLGSGTAGPANPQAVGFAQAEKSIDAAVDGAFAAAGMARTEVAAAVLAVAGSDREENRRRLADWASRRRLARRFRLVHDALPVLAAGTPQGWGVALISGTGSFAFGQSHDGRTARSGGWGFLFGDEGSGYAIAVAALRAAAKAADGRGPDTQLVDALLRELGLAKAEELVSKVYGMAGDRAALAALAGVVFETASQGDRAAEAIAADAAAELAQMVRAVAGKLFSSGDRISAFPLAMSGGILSGSALLRRRIESHLADGGLPAAPVALVDEPVRGAVKLACAELDPPAQGTP